MYPAISLLAILLLRSTPHALALPALADLTSPLSLMSSNPTTNFELPRTRQQNNTNYSSNFLGVVCYHLVPDTVDLHLCQPLFARLMQRGNPYEEMAWWNGWHFRRGIEPCIITLSSPVRQDRRVRISLADVVVYASEVLRTCQETSTGGANTFQGTWRVVVTRYPLEAAAMNSSLSDE